MASSTLVIAAVVTGHKGGGHDPVLIVLFVVAIVFMIGFVIMKRR